MPLPKRVVTAGTVLLVAAALVTTFLISGFVAMRLAIRSREVQVPNLTGLTANEASTLANGVDLTVKVDDARQPDSKIGPDHIRSQDPAPGATTRRQRSIRVWLSAGTRPIPMFVGQTERMAVDQLTRDGLTLAGVAEIRSPNYPSDVVVAQTQPPDGPAGRLALLVNRGEPGGSYMMPDLVGSTGDRAAEVLRARGFRVAVVQVPAAPGTEPGSIVRQAPPAGSQIARSGAISIEVSQ